MKINSINKLATKIKYGENPIDVILKRFQVLRPSSYSKNKIYLHFESTQNFKWYSNLNDANSLNHIFLVIKTNPGITKKALLSILMCIHVDLMDIILKDSNFLKRLGLLKIEKDCYYLTDLTLYYIDKFQIKKHKGVKYVCRF